MAAGPTVTIPTAEPVLSKFTKITPQEGFGDPNNKYAWSMVNFKGDLYVGTANGNIDFTKPPVGTDGCQIWKYEKTPSGRKWKKVVDDGLVFNGMGDPNNFGMRKMIVWNDDPGGPAIYGTTINIATGCEVWRSYDGETWEIVVGRGAMMTRGFGSGRKNSSARGMSLFKGRLYVGLESNNGGELWRTADGVNWEGPLFKANSLEPAEDSLTLADNCVFDEGTGAGEALFTGNWRLGGFSVYKTYDGINFQKVAWDGITSSTDILTTNIGVHKLVSFNHRLWILTFNIGGFDVYASKPGHAINGNSDWELIATRGFTDIFNMYAWNAEVYNNGVEDRLFIGTCNVINGFCIYSVRPNGEWAVEVGTGSNEPNGFGNSNNYGARMLRTWVDDSDGRTKIAVGTAGIAKACDVYLAEPAFEPPVLAPHIDSISPASGQANTDVSIDGSHFGGSQGGSHVSFGSAGASSYSSWADDQIKCTVPSDVSGTVDVTVTTSGGTSNTVAFTVTASPPQPTPTPPTPPITATTPTWYLAEGSTAWGFDDYISILNLNADACTVKITYMTSNGPVSPANITLPPTSQTTVNPRDFLGSQDFSTKVECLEGKSIAVDRTMTWTGPGAPSPEAHSSIGVTSPEKTWYLAEGSSAWGFECWLLVQNPNNQEATCNVTYMIEGSGPQTVTKKVPASSRATFDMSKDIGSKDASIKVTSDVPVIPERAMYRNNRREGHDSIGTTTPANDYYLAEGTTAWGFTTYVLVQNPNDAAANVTVTYMTGAGPQPQAPFSMPANSRKTIRVNDVVPGKDLSTQVHADKPIIAERAMYWGADKPLGEASHDSIGMDSPHMTFYLPDGQSSDGRETWTLVQNPNAEAVTVQISYLTPSGAGNAVFTDTVPASSRKTYNMAEGGINGRAAIMVTSKTAGQKIMVERAMYWNNRGAGADTIGGYSD
jgi:uncharacterized protein (TIGR03437 family)